MDFATRKIVKRQIDSAMRKRIGLEPATVVKTAPEHGSRQTRWTDDRIALALERVAAENGVSVDELRLATYRKARDGNPSIGPSVNRLVPRLAAGIPLLPRKLA